MQDLTVSMIQTSLTWQNPAANRARFDDLIAQIETPTDLIVLPEMFSTGFTMDAAENFETMDGETIDWMEQVARQFNTTLCGSLIIQDAGRFYNRLIWMTPDGLGGYYDKRHLFRVANEQDHYTAGQTRIIFSLNGWRICPLVCYDLRFPVWSRGINEFDALVYVANWPAPRKSAWRGLLPARAIENLCYTIGVNRIGTDESDKLYVGDSVVCDYLGHYLENCGGEEKVTTTILDGDALARYREKFPAHLDADAFSLTDRKGI